MSDPHVLDTSALLAHCREEVGYEIIDQLLEQTGGSVFVSAITWLEFQLRLRELIPAEEVRREVISIYNELLRESLPVTREVAEAALDLRLRVPQRIPNGDALIAATAKLINATLVHRDPHLAAIPMKLVKQIVLPEKPAPEQSRPA
jgi:predicted nucleic acid-binding protein